MPEGWQEVSHILAIQLDSIDRIMPALQALHQALPNPRITLMTPDRSQACLPIDNICGTIWQHASGSGSPNSAEIEALIVKLRSYQFDAAVIFNSSFQSPYPLAYLCYLAGIPIRLGQSKEFGGSVLSHWVKPPPDNHSVDRHLFLLESLGLAPRRDASSPVTHIGAVSEGNDYE